MIDFDALVLAPAMDAFARPISVDPVMSQPGEQPYAVQRDGVSPLRGDFRDPHETVQLVDGTLTTSDPVLGIRAVEFLILPAQEDLVTIGLRRFTVLDVRPDGEGDVKLVLREISAV